MTEAPPKDAWRRLVRRIEPGATLLRSWRLAGGVSAEMTALEVERPDGGTRRVVVRRHGEADRGRNPRIARDEFALLELVRSHGVPAPEPLYLDEAGALLPTPFLVVDFVDGATDVAPADVCAYAARAASALARIHRIKDGPDLAFLPRLGDGFGDRPAELDASLGEGRIRDALEAARPAPRPNPPVLLHGDYWPGNLLWKDGELAAVVDWEDAGVGDPLADLATGRLEFLWAFGADAVRVLTDRYRSTAPDVDVTGLPYWDLCAALRPCSRLTGWGLDEATERRMRDQHRRFVDRALADLAAA